MRASAVQVAAPPGEVVSSTGKGKYIPVQVTHIQYGKSKHYGEWKAEQEQRPTWRGFIKADIDEAIRMSLTERQFFRHLEEKGYEIKMGKDISVRPQGKERFVRLMRNFGEEYSIENIRRRILSQYLSYISVILILVCFKQLLR